MTISHRTGAPPSGCTADVTGTPGVALAVEELQARMTRRFIDIDEAFAQLSSEHRWQDARAARQLRRARRLVTTSR